MATIVSTRRPLVAGSLPRRRVPFSRLLRALADRLSQLLLHPWRCLVLLLLVLVRGITLHREENAFSFFGDLAASVVLFSTLTWVVVVASMIPLL